MAVSDVTKEALDERVAGKTIPSMFLETARANPDLIALRRKVGDGWMETTYREYEEQVARATTGLEQLGVAPGDRVVLMMRNRPEFHVFDVAALMCGATPISIYNSSSPDQVQYLAGHCKAKVAIVEDIGFLERFLKVRDELPDLETIVVLEDPDGLAPDDVVQAATVLGADPANLDECAQRAKPDDLATVIYTSGTTGPPKGVQLSHYNIAWTIESYLAILDIKPEV